MSTLSLCPSCNRHAKRSESACPFCGAELSQAARQVKLPVGAKRAVLFALGLGAATAGCDAFADPVDDDDSSSVTQDVPVYGATPAPNTGTSTTMPGTTMGATAAPQPTGSDVPSGPPEPSTTGTPPTASMPEPMASLSATGATSGTGFTPDSGTAANGGGGSGGVHDPGPDAAVADAAAPDAAVADAAAPDAGPADSATSMPGPVPPYGAPPQPVYGAPPAAP